MGYDITYMAMPEHPILSEWLKDNPKRYGDFLIYYYNGLADIDSFQKATQNENGQNDETEFAEIANSLIQSHPGLEKRILYAKRSWDVLCYLLSGARRERKHDNYVIEYTDLAERAILGGDIISSVFASQDLPIRRLAPREVRQAHLLFQTIGVDQFGKYFDIPAMQKAEVHKSLQMHQDDETLKLLWHDFEELRAFYSQLSSHNEGVVVDID